MKLFKIYSFKMLQQKSLFVFSGIQHVFQTLYALKTTMENIVGNCVDYCFQSLVYLLNHIRFQNNTCF
jgi:hypothetical protein